MRVYYFISLFTLLLVVGGASAETATVKASAAKETVVGVPTLLSGDFAGLGENIVNTVKTYEKFYLRHPIRFVYEDAKISGVDGLKAYQKLIVTGHQSFNPYS